MLETGKGEAMIAFRGSEDFKNPDNLMKDWIGSDLGLLNSALTPQQAMAERYMNRLYQKYGDDYNSFNITGHSLGGNLAEHAAITAPDNMRSRIDRCVNLDGPGFSKTYLVAHANDIRKSRGIIDHYQWSLVGTLLNAAPGTNYRTIKAKTPEDKGALSIFWRHDTKNVTEFDKNGNVLPGEKDWLSQHTKEISNLIDNSLLSIGILGAAVLYNFMDIAIDEIRNLMEWSQEAFIQGGRAEFSVRIKPLYDCMGQFANAEEIIRSVCMETENIRANLALHSLSGGYIKYKLWRTTNSMERLANRIRTYRDVGETCVELYQRHDRTAAEKYQAI